MLMRTYCVLVRAFNPYMYMYVCVYRDGLEDYVYACLEAHEERRKIEWFPVSRARALEEE